MTLLTNCPNTPWLAKAVWDEGPEFRDLDLDLTPKSPDVMPASQKDYRP